MTGLDDAILAAIGEIFFHFSHLESSLKYQTWRLIDPNRPQTGIIVTAGMDFRRILELFSALVRDRIGPDDESALAVDLRVRLGELIAIIDASRAARNVVAHSHWMTTEVCETVTGGTPESFVLRFKENKDMKGWRSQFEALTVDYFRNVSSGVIGARRKLDEFVARANRVNPIFPIIRGPEDDL